MLLIILLSILVVVGITVGYLIDIYDYTYSRGEFVGFFYLIGGVSAITLIISLCFLIGINKRFDAMIYQYETTVEMVNSYTGQDYGNMGELVGQVVRINNGIANHKARYNSVWVGLWYSERIGSLEPIKFGGGKNKPALE